MQTEARRTKDPRRGWKTGKHVVQIYNVVYVIVSSDLCYLYAIVRIEFKLIVFEVCLFQQMHVSVWSILW